ncbi:hypothetical protein [Actinoplanes sp. GCM10030250]|uniref:hypothetical protein n=1 Tax=Actinoplanes sp. GCM10030250 TaxID=3273376 RepID=UPI003618DD58
MTTQLEARTLAEAYLFVELVVGRNVPVDLRQITDLSYVDGHRVLQVNGVHDGEQHDFTIVVPSVALRGDIRPGEFYGEGTEPSVLIDAGQWRGVEDFAAANIGILLEQAGGGALTPDAVNEIAKNLESACSALAEIGKFLPEGADEVPAEAFWTDTGRLIRERQPEAFRRDRLVRDEAEYQSMAGQITAFLAGA